MTEAQAVEAITALFVTAWPTASSNIVASLPTGVPYALPNKALAPTGDAFVQLKMLPYQRLRLTQGPGGTKQQWKYVTLIIFVRENTGSLAGNLLADAARAVFEDQTLAVGSEHVTLDLGMPSADGKLTGYDVTSLRVPAYWFE